MKKDGGPATKVVFLVVGLLQILLRPAEARLVASIVNHMLNDTASHPPLLLSRTGLYKDIAAKPRVVSDSVYPYEVNAALWSDGAYKERFITVPFGKKIVPTDSANYAFPDGTVLIKNFAIDTVAGDTASRILIETRFLVVQTVDAYPYYSGLSYHWRRDQTDADLVPQKSGEDALHAVNVGGKAMALRWRYPSKQECNRCHVPEYRGSLGFITQQLNRPAPGRPGLNQLQDLADKGVLASNPIQGKPDAFHWHAVDDSGASLEVRARSYLAANCSHCHGNTYNEHARHSFEYFDSSQSDVFSLATNYRGYVGRTNDGDTLTPQFIYPGRPDSSFILRRMLSRGTFDEPNGAQMPPIATYQVDSMALKVLRDWVCSLGSPPTAAASCKLPDVPEEPYADALKGARHPDGAGGSGIKAFFQGSRLSVTYGHTQVTGDIALFDARGRRIGLTPEGAGIFLMHSRPHPGLYFLKVGAGVLSLPSL